MLSWLGFPLFPELLLPMLPEGFRDSLILPEKHPGTRSPFALAASTFGIHRIHSSATAVCWVFAGV